MQNIKKIGRCKLLPYLLLYIFLAVCHLLFKMNSGDDAYYATVIPNMGLLPYLVWSYSSWAARTLVDIPMLVMNWLPHIVWQLVNPLLIVLSGWAMVQITGGKNSLRAAWAVCGLLLLYPWQVMDSAGWITTTTVYLWPATAALLAMVPAAKALRTQKLPAWQWVPAIPGILYAANMEQVLIVILPLLGAAIGFCLVRKIRVHPLFWAGLAACAANLVWVLLCPGTRHRFGQESAGWFPNFAMRTVLQKMEHGASSALHEVLFSRNLPFFFLCLLLCWLVWKNNRGVLYRILGVVPLAVCALLGMYGGYTEKLAPAVGFFRSAVGGEGSVTLANAGSLLAYLPMLLLYTTFCIILADIYLALGHSPAAFWGIYAFCFGFASRAAMGFTPTIGVSGPRTSYFFQLTTLALCVLLFRKATQGSRLPIGPEQRPGNKSWPMLVFSIIFLRYCLLQLYSIQELRIATGY